MALRLAGAFLVILGLFCAAALLLAPLGLMVLPAQWVLWGMFPLLTLIGLFLLAMSGRARHTIQFTFWVSLALLAMALTAVTCVVLAAAGLLALSPNSASLWYVLITAGTLGTAGVATSRPAPRA